MCATDKQNYNISVVIVNYNSGIFLSRCIKSLIDTDGFNQIFIVDNASTDDSIRCCDAIPGVTVIQNSKNSGFSQACNRGIKASSCDYVFFLNPDCEVLSGTATNLAQVLSSQADIGMVGGYLQNRDGSEQAGGRRAMPTPWRSFVRAFGLYHLNRLFPRLFFDFHLHNQPLPKIPSEVEAISGACMLVKREAIDDVGLWDEDYFLHCEDLDWCMRFHQKGWKIMFVPEAKVTHVGGACSKSRPVFVEWHKHKGMQRFYRKFYKDQYPSLLWPAVVATVWLRFSTIVCHYAVRRLFETVKFSRA